MMTSEQASPALFVSNRLSAPGIHESAFGRAPDNSQNKERHR